MEITTEEAETITAKGINAYMDKLNDGATHDGALEHAVEFTIDLVEEAMQAKTETVTEQLAAKLTARIADAGPGISLSISPAALDRGLHWVMHQAKDRRDQRRDVFEALQPLLMKALDMLEVFPKASRANGRDHAPPAGGEEPGT